MIKAILFKLTFYVGAWLLSLAIKVVDTNNDGEISAEELSVAVEKIKSFHKSLKNKSFF
jgi:hypothetical protein